MHRHCHADRARERVSQRCVGLSLGAPESLATRSRQAIDDHCRAIRGRGASTRSKCLLEDLEPNDIDGDFRFAPGDGTRQFIDLYLYDQAAGGAGFVKAAARDPQRLVDAALQLLDSCSCDDSCYQCLRSYKNRYDHALFDRHIGADLLRACFKGAPLSSSIPRGKTMRSSVSRERSRGKRRDGDPRRGRPDPSRSPSHLRCQHPFLDREPCSKRARELADGKRRDRGRSLACSCCAPCRSRRTSRLRCTNVDSRNRALKPSADGVPRTQA